MDTIDWNALPRAVVYEVRTSTGWMRVSASIYRTIQNPDNRRILMRATKTINNQTLSPLP